MSARDIRGRSSFQVTSTELLFFFAKVLPGDDKGSSNIQVTSLNMGYF